MATAQERSTSISTTASSSTLVNNINIITTNTSSANNAAKPLSLFAGKAKEFDLNLAGAAAEDSKEINSFAIETDVQKLVKALTLEELVDKSNATTFNGIASSGVSSRSSSLAGTMFSDNFEAGKANELDSGPLEDAAAANNDGMDKLCKICNSRYTSPRVLACLHVFCEPCLNKLVTTDDAGSSSSRSSLAGGVADRLSPIGKCSIECPTCKQITILGAKGVESLICDYVSTNILDLSSIESEQLSCTSCKSKEKAISRCSDCANFLCGGCDNAHKYMRCFENHEVIKLEDLQKATADKPLTIHKPLFCKVHTSENLKYYCFSCQLPVCNDCLIADHKGNDHHYDSLTAAERSVRNDVENLMKEARSKVQYCDDAAGNLNCALTELQTQYDAASFLIRDTYHDYTKILDNCRDTALVDLGKLHSERELKVMDLLQNIENAMRKIEDTCDFASRILDQANAAEFLSMKKLMSTQLMHLINSTPKCDVNFSLVFEPKPEKFEQVVQQTFGKFRTESMSPSPKESTPPPTLPGIAPNMARGALNSSSSSQGQHASSVTASSPISLTSMQSSFDGELSVLGNGFMLSNMHAPDSPPQQHHSSLQQLHHQQQQQQHSQLQQQQHQPPQSHAGVNGFGGLGAVGNGGGAAAGNNLNGLLSGGNMLNAAAAAGNMSHTSLNSGVGAHLNQSLNNTLSGSLGSGGMNGSGAAVGMNHTLGNTLANNISAGIHNSSNNGNAPNAPPAYNSILEYNLTRLASMTETVGDNLSDGLVGAAAGAAHHQSIVPSHAHGTAITLADIISGDQRAFNNLQALAKLGMNNNDFHGDMINDMNYISNGSSSGIDGLFSDFCMPPPTSPSLSTLNSLGATVDDMSITNFHANAAPGTTSIVTGRSKATPMQIRCKFGSLGTSKGQFNSPHGFCLGVDEEIIVADTNNHRIEVFDKTGTLKFQFGVPGKEEGQLWYPRKVAVMHTNGKFVVCDRGNERSRMQIFTKSGHFLRKIAIRYIDIVAGLAVTNKGHIVAVDSVSPTVFVISEEGELVRWFDCSDYMREPSDIAIRDSDFYVCDFKGHCVAVFQEDGTFQYRIGNEKVTCFPNGIDISNAGDILIGDSHGNRFHVACYSREGILQSEFECPHVKVSRCCGLKITSEGYVVTLAKNNHHVLVLNTLYVH